MNKKLYKWSILGIVAFGAGLASVAHADNAPYQSIISNITQEPYAKSEVQRDWQYALTDIDKNGQDELIVGNKQSDGTTFPIAIYYLNANTPTLLAYSFVGGSARVTFSVYTDGAVKHNDWSSGTGLGTAKLYQLSKDNGEAVVVQENENFQATDRSTDIDVSGKTEVDLKSLDYKPLTQPIENKVSTHSSEEITKTIPLPKAMREASIGQEINFPRELVGTWTTVEKPNGSKPGRPSSLEISEDSSYAAIYSDGNITGNMLTLRKVTENAFVITSDRGDFGLVGRGGSAGPNAKFEYGIILEGQTLKNVEWVVTIGAEDYSKPNVLATFTNSNFMVKETEDIRTTSTIKKTSSTTDATAKKQNKSEEKKLFGILPNTGESRGLLSFIGLGILTGAILLVVKRKKSEN